MADRKITADKIFDGFRLHENKALIVDDKGRIKDLIAVEDAGTATEKYEGILSPGLINCHCHLELSHMKGKIPEKTGLVDFVFKIVTQRSTDNDEMLAAVAAAEAAMLQNGIVAVGDICNTAVTVAQKQKHNLRYYNFIEASGWLPAVSEPRFQNAKALYNTFNSISDTPNHQRVEGAAGNAQTLGRNASIVPHAPYSVSAGLWKQIQPYFKHKVVTIHNQETKFEDAFFLHGTGDLQRMYELMHIDNSHHIPTATTSLQAHYKQLVGAAKIILVHNTFTTSGDVAYIKRLAAQSNDEGLPTPETFFCLCPNANLYIEDQLPPLNLFRQNNCTIVFGTDSLASNRSLNILDEIKTLLNNPQGSLNNAGLEEMLQWATINGARALSMDDVLGSFEKGKQPGGILICENDLTVTQRLF